MHVLTDDIDALGMQVHVEVIGPELHAAARVNFLGNGESRRGRSRAWNETDVKSEGLFNSERPLE